MAYQMCKARQFNLLTPCAGPAIFARNSPRTPIGTCLRRSHEMRVRLAALCLLIFLVATVASAQRAPDAAYKAIQPDFNSVNCSGFATDQKVPDGIQLISGEQSNYKITFSRGDFVYINRGQDKGVRVGDRFSVVRPDKDFTD